MYFWGMCCFWVSLFIWSNSWVVSTAVSTAMGLLDDPLEYMHLTTGHLILVGLSALICSVVCCCGDKD